MEAGEEEEEEKRWNRRWCQSPSRVRPVFRPVREFSMRRSFYRSRRLPRRPLRQGGGGVFTLDVSFVFASGRYGRRASADAVFQKDAFTLVLNSSRVLFTHALASLSLCVCLPFAHF